MYIGRGWDRVGAHTKGYNDKSIAISFMGNYVIVPPTDRMLTAAQELIQCGIDQVSGRLFVCLSVLVCVCVCLDVCLSLLVCILVCVYVSGCLFVYVSVYYCLWVYLSICVCQFVCLYQTSMASERPLLAVIAKYASN